MITLRYTAGGSGLLRFSSAALGVSVMKPDAAGHYVWHRRAGLSVRAGNKESQQPKACGAKFRQWDSEILSARTFGKQSRRQRNPSTLYWQDESPCEIQLPGRTAFRSTSAPTTFQFTRCTFDSLLSEPSLGSLPVWEVGGELSFVLRGLGRLFLALQDGSHFVQGEGF